MPGRGYPPSAFGRRMATWPTRHPLQRRSRHERPQRLWTMLRPRRLLRIRSGPELLELIPRSAHRVLDVGCGAGRLGEALKARQRAEVVGIELSPAAARRAEPRLDRVLVGDVERMDLNFAPKTFDCIVCGDVLEHLRAPERFLGRVRDWLGPEGVLVASLPNVRHHSVVTSLLGGDWTYEPAGLLDETHLSFFTRADLLALFERSGYRVTQTAFLPTPEHDAVEGPGSPGEVRIGALQIGGLPPEEAEEFFVYQYLLTAEPVARSDHDERRSEQWESEQSATRRPALALVGAGAVELPSIANGRPSHSPVSMKTQNERLRLPPTRLGPSTRLLPHRAEEPHPAECASLKTF